MAIRKFKVTLVAYIIFVLYSDDLDQFYKDLKISLKVSGIAFARENFHKFQ